jgi:hypothetical protein
LDEATKFIKYSHVFCPQLPFNFGSFEEFAKKKIA